MSAAAATPLVVLRHGPTAWNETGRIQGRSDPPLSPAGIAQVEAWRLPADLAGYRWLTSPLRRAVETARLLGHAEAQTEPALVEMAWGQWEGRTLEELRASGGVALRENESRGLDFAPPEGESPRQVQRRLQPLLAKLAQDMVPCVAICHKGLIRALYALARGWDLTGEPPEKLREPCLHRFALDAAGAPRVEQLNLPLLP